MIMPITTLRQRCVIIDVDTQRDFFRDSGLACVYDHKSVLTNIRKVMTWGRLRNIPVISTVPTYDISHPFRHSYLAETDGQEKLSYTLRNKRISFDAMDCTDLPLGILDSYDQVILHKRCFDPFEEPRADRMFTELQAYECILIGAVMEDAVKATVLGLLARQKNVTILVDAIGLWNKSEARVALRYMWAKGAKLIDTKHLLTSWRPPLVRACDYSSL